jgi:hypothetical protein
MECQLSLLDQHTGSIGALSSRTDGTRQELRGSARVEGVVEKAVRWRGIIFEVRETTPG